MTARVIGIGQRFAGDDAVGLEVVRRLDLRDDRVEVLETNDPSRLVEWLCGIETAVVVDAVIDGGPPGRVVEREAGEIDSAPGRLFSTHGLGVGEALGLARVLHPETLARRIVVVGVTIPRPGTGGPGLSPRVEASLDRAANAVRGILRRGPR